ncbi:glutamine synthetase [Candidatus Daviesbacteria bacterium RIFCSPHIGHO2_01_FULL_38_8b]|nr:MAG: glutamine synthetase [Candidatus Daviesbacteria bacterium RIFCSPHIGHO2_01_FULL_38_8b]
MQDNSILLKNFLEIPYEELEEMNLKAKERQHTVSNKVLEEEYRLYLKKEKRIKAVTLCFTDIEGRFHILDYDKKYLLESASNLTFDGSSIKGFTALHESDLRLEVDWASIIFLPSDVFGGGKVVMFADVLGRDKTPYISDFRGQLKLYTKNLKETEGIVVHTATETEGFLVEGVGAEQSFDEDIGFKLISTGGYFHSLPLDRLRKFIDAAAEAQRAMGFKNEKDHPEVAPSQFELNFSYTEVVRACDQIQLYKLVCRQVANNMGMTATFLPKPIANINGSGMHTNFSMAKNGKNIFYQKNGQDTLSELAWDFIFRILNHAPEICLILNSSVNAYRRLDPYFEAPNQIKVSPIDRGSMIRIPTGNEKTARIEIRSVAPDTNPYLALFTILKTGLEGKKPAQSKNRRVRLRFLPGTIHDAIRLFKASDFTAKILGEENKQKYLSFKETVADRSPKELGKLIKTSEIIYHHEVTNQVLWNNF